MLLAEIESACGFLHFIGAVAQFSISAVSVPMIDPTISYVVRQCYDTCSSALHRMPAPACEKYAVAIVERYRACVFESLILAAS